MSRQGRYRIHICNIHIKLTINEYIRIVRKLILVSTHSTSKSSTSGLPPLLSSRYFVDDLRQTRVSTEHEAHDAKHHDGNILPQQPVVLAQSVRPERDDLDDGRKYQRQCRAAECADQRNYELQIGDNGGQNNCIVKDKKNMANKTFNSSIATLQTQYLHVKITIATRMLSSLYIFD